jgi:EmrB/QacA subfamily drug resistance transporter
MAQAFTLPNPSAANPAVNARRWWVLAVMSLTTFMVFLDNTVVNTALPSISRDLGASTSTLQWIVDSYTLLLAGLLLVGGSIGDRFGRRRFLTVGMVIFGVGAAGAAISNSAESLILMRGLQGVGAALVLPATLSIITDVFPREERAKAIGIWTGAGAVALAAGPVFGGFLVDEIGWSAVFWMHIPVVMLALFGLRIVPESRDRRALGLDIRGGLLATSGLLALVFGIIQGNDSGWTSTLIVGAFGLGIGLLLAFAVTEIRSRTPMLPLRFFKQRDFNGAVLIIGLVFFALMVTFFFLTQFFQLVQGRSAFTAGLFMLPAAGMMMVGAPISGVLSRSVGPKILTTVAGMAMTFGLLWLTQLNVDSSFLTVAIGIMAFGFGGGMALAPLTDTVMAAVPVNDAGIGSAVNDVSRELGAALGIATVGSFVGSLYGSNVETALEGVAPASVVETVSEGIGVAAVTLPTLPADLAETVSVAANGAFVDAITTGMYISAGFAIAATLAAALLMPRKMRETQAEAVVETTGSTTLTGTLVPATPRATTIPALAPVPVMVEPAGYVTRDDAA